MNLKNVPSNLRHLAPLAKRWGISDDGYRADALKAATPQELGQLKGAVSDHDDLLDEWLAGPEAAGPYFTDEYIMYSAMRMAADSIPRR